jgi:3-oxoacyl-[acyl-carrier-protein] synthase II
MNKRVVITGLGVISSVGIGRDDFWESLMKGKSGISPVTSFDTTDYFTHNGGEVKHFEPKAFIPENHIQSLSRASQFAIAASKLAMKDADLFRGNIGSIRAGTCIGTTMGSVQTVEILNERSVIRHQSEFSSELIYQIPTHSAPASVSKEFGLSGPLMMFSTACAAGNYAIGYGFDLIQLGRADIVLAGGSDPFSKVAFTGFNQLSAVAPDKCRPFDKNRKGMMVAEGAGILVLEALENARKRNARVYAEILGYGLSCDAQHMTQPSVEGISRCMMSAISSTGIRKEDIDYISAHGTGTPANDKAECAAIKEVFGEKRETIPISSIKSMLGHTMGAASAIEAIACALAIRNDMVPPTINYETPDPECDIDCVPNQARRHIINLALNNSYAFGGNNASLVLKKFTE